MVATRLNADRLVGSIHRAVLGALLAIFVVLGIGVAISALPAGSYVVGGLGAAVALGVGYWILSLFAEGLRER